MAKKMNYVKNPNDISNLGDIEQFRDGDMTYDEERHFATQYALGHGLTRTAFNDGYGYDSYGDSY